MKEISYDTKWRAECIHLALLACTSTAKFTILEAVLLLCTCAMCWIYYDVRIMLISSVLPRSIIIIWYRWKRLQHWLSDGIVSKIPYVVIKILHKQAFIFVESLLPSLWSPSLHYEIESCLTVQPPLSNLVTSPDGESSDPQPHSFGSLRHSSDIALLTMCLTVYEAKHILRYRGLHRNAHFVAGSR